MKKLNSTMKRRLEHDVKENLDEDQPNQVAKLNEDLPNQFTKLDNFTLLKIFSYLDIVDLYKASQTCQKFKEIITYSISTSNTANFGEFELSSLTLYAEAAQNFSDVVKSVVCAKADELFLRNVVTRLPNLTSLTLPIPEAFGTLDLDVLVGSCPNLASLQIGSLDRLSECKMLPSPPCLQTNALRTFPNLTDLSLYIKNITDVCEACTLSSFIRLCHNIETLNIAVVTSSLTFVCLPVKSMTRLAKVTITTNVKSFYNYENLRFDGIAFEFKPYEQEQRDDLHMILTVSLPHWYGFGCVRTTPEVVE